MTAALKRIGFRVGRVWRSVAADVDEDLEQRFRELHADLLAGVPSIVGTRFDERPNTTEHFRLVLGYDADDDQVIYHKPAEDDGALRRMSRSRLLKLWPLKSATDRWTVIRLRLEPGDVRGGQSGGFTSADFAQHVMRLKARIPSELFTIVVQRPFVVVGDEASEVVRRRSQRTVKWAVDHLKKAYFKKDPEHIIDIWLFKDKESYQRNTSRLFKVRPTTPYGFYSAANQALINYRHARDRRRRREGPDIGSLADQLADRRNGVSKLWRREHDRYILEHLLALAVEQFQPMSTRAFRLNVLQERPAHMQTGFPVSAGGIRGTRAFAFFKWGDMYAA